MRVFVQCNINGNVPVTKQLLKNQEDSFQQLISKETSLKRKRFILTKKITTYQGNSILVLSLGKSQIMHAEEFVLIPRRMFISKNTTKEEIFDNPIYQKATQLSLLQRSNPNFEQSSGKKDADTSTDRRITRTRSIGDGTSDPDDAKSELFVSDDSEIEPVVKKRKDSALDSIMLELKLMDENKTNRAAIILKKSFVSDNVSISEENNVLHIEDEPQGVKVTNFLYNLQQPTKKFDVQKISKILSELDIAAHLVYNTHAKKVLDEFYSEEEEEQPTRKQKKQQQKQPRGRSETKEKSAKPKVDESKKKTDEDTSRKDWASYR